MSCRSVKRVYAGEMSRCLLSLSSVIASRRSRDLDPLLHPPENPLICTPKRLPILVSSTRMARMPVQSEREFGPETSEISVKTRPKGPRTHMVGPNTLNPEAGPSPATPQPRPNGPARLPGTLPACFSSRAHPPETSARLSRGCQVAHHVFADAPG